jgi:hypothetical protein
MSETVSVVMQTTAAVANILKPLIESGDCKVNKMEKEIFFHLTEGSAKIIIVVTEHPEIENDAVVKIFAPFTIVENIDMVDSKLLVQMLCLNARFGNFAFVYDKNSKMLALKGTLIGSTMDLLEFKHLFISLAKAADALDEELLEALSASADDKAGKETDLVSDNLIQLSKKILEILDDKAPHMVEAFIKKLDVAARAEFEKITQDDEIRNALREIAFGIPAAKLTAILLSEDLTDADRKLLATRIMESLPDNALMMQLLAFVVTRTSIALADVAGLTADVIEGRITTTFAGN